MWRKELGADEVVVLRERKVKRRVGQVLTSALIDELGEMMEAHQTHSDRHHCCRRTTCRET